MTLPSELTLHYVLTAGESDAEGRMPLTLLVERLIEAATNHANRLGIGYATLIKRNIGWVLSRVSIEMSRYPAINEEYSVCTWIETYNRRFSERNFELRGGDGAVIGYARSVWVPMDFATRTTADLAAFGSDPFPICDRPCPIARAPRIGALSDGAACGSYTFRFCDIDFNRHVNTVRYVELLLNHWPLERYDNATIGRFDVLFHHECHFGDTVELRVDETQNGSATHSICEIVRDGGTRAVAAAIDWQSVAVL